MRPFYWACPLLMLPGCAKQDEASSAALQPQAALLAPPQSLPVRVDGVLIATRWLDALRDGNQQELATATQYPFELHGDGVRCATQQVASSGAQLPLVLQCLLADSALLDVMRTHDSAAVEPLPDVHWAAWAEKWHVAATPVLQIVTGFYNRDDVRLNLDLWVTAQGVRGAWQNGLEGSRQVKIAREWLDALRARDLERLARITSFPFEVRDTRREATCGKRVATSAATLAAATNCLFHADLLHRALVDSPSPGLTADDPTDTLPAWIAGWWREKEHRGLERVSTMVSTTEGYEFDFQMLIAPDGGVRTVWKHGAFESRQ